MNLTHALGGWIETAIKFTILIGVLVGIREGRQAHKRGLINSEKIEYVDKAVNGKVYDPPADPPIPR
jgi:hypothetical protein